MIPVYHNDDTEYEKRHHSDSMLIWYYNFRHKLDIDAYQL